MLLKCEMYRNRRRTVVWKRLRSAALCSTLMWNHVWAARSVARRVCGHAYTIWYMCLCLYVLVYTCGMSDAEGCFVFFLPVCVCWCETVYAALLRAFAITDCQKEKDFREVSFSLFKVGALWDMFGILIHSLKMACDLKPLTGSACSVSVSHSLSLPFSFPLALWSDYPACDSTDTHMSPRDVPSLVCLICLPVQ